MEAFSIHFASELRAVVLGIDYRLAPEHPYPAALDDCWQALEWVGTLFLIMDQMLT
jgi:acetyl esterase/lipase